MYRRPGPRLRWRGRRRPSPGSRDCRRSSGRPIGVDREVALQPGDARVAAQEMAVGHDGSADPVAQRQHHSRAGAPRRRPIPSRPPGPRAQRCRQKRASRGRPTRSLMRRPSRKWSAPGQEIDAGAVGVDDALAADADAAGNRWLPAASGSRRAGRAERSPGPAGVRMVAAPASHRYWKRPAPDRGPRHNSPRAAAQSYRAA